MNESSGTHTTAALKATGFPKGGRQICGPLQLDNGTIYEGEWFNGIRDGLGK